MEVKFRIYKKTRSCEIKCPVSYPGPMVGSIACKECKNFISIDPLKMIVNCKGVNTNGVF